MTLPAPADVTTAPAPIPAKKFTLQYLFDRCVDELDILHNSVYPDRDRKWINGATDSTIDRAWREAAREMTIKSKIGRTVLSAYGLSAGFAFSSSSLTLEAIATPAAVAAAVGVVLVAVFPARVTEGVRQGVERHRGVYRRAAANVKQEIKALRRIRAPR